MKRQLRVFRELLALSKKIFTCNFNSVEVSVIFSYPLLMLHASMIFTDRTKIVTGHTPPR